MNSLTKKHGICLILLAFVLSFIGSSLQAATKQEMYQLGKEIKSTQTQISSLYAELRKLNEEGGPDSQEKAQLIMDHIQELKERLARMQKSLDQMKKGTDNISD